jgi:hypothetical protein
VGLGENQLISSSTQSQYLKTSPKPVPEIIDPVFAKTSQNACFLLSENERFGLVFVKTGSINSGTDLIQNKLRPASLGTDWIENERFGLIFAKTIIFMAKSGSINSGMG